MDLQITHQWQIIICELHVKLVTKYYNLDKDKYHPNPISLPTNKNRGNPLLKMQKNT